MDWALSGLQLVLGGNKWSGRHAEYTTLAGETPTQEHLGNLFRKKIGILAIGQETGDDRQKYWEALQHSPMPKPNDNDKSHS